MRQVFMSRFYINAIYHYVSYLKSPSNFVDVQSRVFSIDLDSVCEAARTIDDRQIILL